MKMALANARYRKGHLLARTVSRVFSPCEITGFTKALGFVSLHTRRLSPRMELS